MANLQIGHAVKTNDEIRTKDEIRTINETRYFGISPECYVVGDSSVCEP